MLLTQHAQQVEDTYELLALAHGEEARSTCSGGHCSLCRSGAMTSSIITCAMFQASRCATSNGSLISRHLGALKLVAVRVFVAKASGSYSKVPKALKRRDGGTSEAAAKEE